MSRAICSSDDPEPMRRAIRNGFDVDKHPNASNFFLTAIVQDRWEIFKTMLEASANRDCLLLNRPISMHDDSDDSTYYGPGSHLLRSPLSVACACVSDSELRRKMVKLLLEHGASVDFDPERHSESCAHAALKFADCELLELLSRSGADLNCLDRVIQHRSDESRDLLIPDERLVERGGNTPLHKVMLGIAFGESFNWERKWLRTTYVSTKSTSI
ncbi:hypothetical protein QAD02_024286 [Eretmocerus hayati]|uniref:Uncharacterized protein n=1 Tax=Eretmocerus hayati TaxID=131215 RepID=A0ACC2PY68_9HYME|nr:hypothetical protein QAD02_024286 [Eretmocerus hayati]